MDLKKFRLINGLTQEKLGDYLGLKKSFICQIEHGRNKLPKARYRKLINNPHGWDVSMLVEQEPINAVPQSQDDVLIAELRAQIEKLENKIDNLNQELGEKNALIKMMSKGGQGSVQGVIPSLSANVG